jgi:hypothetical protein
MARKKDRKKRIICLIGAQIELAKKYGCMKSTVSHALNFKSNSLQAESIREDAISNYKGKIVYLE